MSFKEFLSSKREKVHVYHVSPKSDIYNLKPTGFHSGQQSISLRQAGIYVAPKFSDAVAWAASYVAYKKSKEKHQDLVYKNLTIYEIEIPKDILQKAWKNDSWEPEYFISKEHMSQMRIVKSKTYSQKDLFQMYNTKLSKRSETYLNAVGNIKKVGKKNIAAKYYLEITDELNRRLLKKRNNQAVAILRETIKEKLDSLKNYIFKYPDGFHEEVIILTPAQETEVNAIYNEIKNLLTKLDQT